MAFSAAKNDWLGVAEAHLSSIIRELLEAGQEPGEVWNVNFPAMKTVGLKGILRDRTVAPVSMFTEKYIETKLPDGRVVLTCQGIPITNDQIPEGTDAKAVRNGYIAISKVKCTL